MTTAIHPPTMMHLLINHHLIAIGALGSTLGVVVIKATDWIQQLDPAVGFLIKVTTLVIMLLTVIKLYRELFGKKKEAVKKTVEQED